MTAPQVLHRPAPSGMTDRAIAVSARWFVRPNLALPLPWAVKRRSFALAGRTRPVAPGITQSRIKLAGRSAVIFAPPAPERRILWVHGGGFVVGSPTSHRGMLSHLARASNAAVIAPKYRLAPEHPFPAAVADIEAAIDASDAVRPDLGALVLGGDSAGGTLALVALAHTLRAGSSARIAGVMLASPATDLDPARPVPAADDLLFPVHIFRRIQAAYIRDADPRDPRLSPVHGAYRGAPPVLIHACVGEYLEADTDLIAARLAGQGVAVTVEKYPGLPHVFHFMAGTSPSADAAVARFADFARERTGSRAGDQARQVT